jgi:hypothetical protein
MNITQIVMAVLCVGGVSFLLGMLRALLRENKGGSSRAVEVYFAKFIPPKKRGELIVIDFNTGRRKLQRRTSASP